MNKKMAINIYLSSIKQTKMYYLQTQAYRYQKQTHINGNLQPGQLIVRVQNYDSVRKKMNKWFFRKLVHDVKNIKVGPYFITYLKNYTQMDQRQKHEKYFKVTKTRLKYK